MNINNLKRLEKIIFSISNSYHVSFLRYSSNAIRRNTKIESESRYLAEDFLPNTILNKKIKTWQDWENVRQELLDASKQITPKTIDSIILSTCISSKNYDIGLNYFQFLKQQSIGVGLAAIGKYFRLFYLSNCKKAEVDNEEIYSLYKTLRAQYEVCDATTCDNVIHALSITPQWRECFKLLDEIKVTCDAGKQTYSIIAAACFRNREFELGWNILNECITKGHSPQSVAYVSYINALEHSDKSRHQMEKLFNFFNLYDIQCDNEVADSIINFYGKLHLDVKFLTFRNSIKCTNCGTSLKNSDLNENDFHELKSAIFENVIVGSNVFYKSTPGELEQFKRFIKNMKKYDVVIDGLNVAYCVGTKQSPQVLSFFVKSVVKHFVDQHKKVLVLGRTHMHKWPKSNWSYVTENADIFLTHSLSHDDPYLLYCALHCGLNTIIVSRDLMRGHVFKLSNYKLKVLFNRWLLQNQYHISFINNQGKVYFKYPPSYTRTAQKLGNTWHIPCCKSRDTDDNSNTWLCLDNNKF